jgi:hypothetical protein
MLHVDVPDDCTTTGVPSVPLANYLRRRGATYSVRVRVPKDLCDTIGKPEIVQALGKVRDPAEAKRKGAEKVREIHARFERLRSGARLTSEMIERECQDIARDAVELLKLPSTPVTREGGKEVPRVVAAHGGINDHQRGRGYFSSLYEGYA